MLPMTLWHNHTLDYISPSIFCPDNHLVFFFFMFKFFVVLLLLALILLLFCDGRKCSLALIAPLEAILFDIDGTLCDSDPLHYYAFREMLQEVGFNGGIPITEEFYSEHFSGKNNEYLCSTVFHDWDLQTARKFLDDKEAMFRR